MRIEPLNPEHWPTVRAIYLEGIATFEQDAPDWPRWDAAHHSHSRLVAVDEDGVAGWAALSLVSVRYVYRGVAEVTIYIAERARGRGVGRALMNALSAASEAAGIWTLQSAIFRENDASIRLHEHAGFRVAGERERIGWFAGEWRTTVLMERLNRRNSSIAERPSLALNGGTLDLATSLPIVGRMRSPQIRGALESLL